MNHVVLVGFMASGKSTVGARVAELLDRPFVDVDARIEEMTSTSIAELFAEFAEPRFRVFEAAVVAQALGGAPAVVAAGGGAPLDDASWRLMNHGNLTVHLDVDVDTVMARLGAGEERPLAGAGLDTDARRQHLDELLRRRAARYAEAMVRLDASRPVEDVAADVVAAAREAGLG